MKRIKYYFTGLAALLLLTASLQAQTLKVMEWNILSFEGINNVAGFNVQPYVDLIKEHNPDVICFNEFETATSRMNYVEKLTEVARLLGMYPFFGFSYVKDVGYYGNGILSKYPYVNTYSSLITKPSGTADQRSVEYVDILVPTAQHPEGVTIRVVCTHLDHQGTANNRRDQARDVKTQTIKDCPYPALLLGDMNQGTTTAAITAYTGDNAYGGAMDRVCDNTTTYGNSSKLDYFFSYPAGKWTKNSYTVVKSSGQLSGGLSLNQLSDHYPIVGVVTLNP
ncbi:MAG: endonuclease/exonuclease/phosphatase family protein [Dysgonamonadaceae bacterium]|jgi:endonuclease/exonuclease/phosphatase family metal-dependent hydrolase|nr:endonuclease/exonuclease/phosphatase family protein [Dysgonamonadaceae bacterium]